LDLDDFLYFGVYFTRQNTVDAGYAFISGEGCDVSTLLQITSVSYLEHDGLCEIVDRKNKGLVPKRVQISINSFRLVVELITNFHFDVGITTSCKSKIK
jgi:hypothetical protein